ncbi:MAG: hypothetical protein ACM3JB_11065 [Acidobacteriaceae bacterium]
MSTESTAEEVHQNYVDAMGPELGNLFFRFWNECVTLHWKWEEYVALFGKNAETVALLNKSAGAFFRIVQDMLFEDVLIHISRLTDPPKSAGKSNLTLRRLPVLIAGPLRKDLDRLLAECEAKCAFARDWRMRRIAHNDLELALGDPHAVPLASASRRAVNEALKSIAALLNAVEMHFKNSTVMYELHPLGNAESLLYVLRDGLRAEEKRHERLRSGRYDPED